ncbi:MAG: pilus assembly protein PilM, partial [Opitutus sp.]
MRPSRILVVEVGAGHAACGLFVSAAKGGLSLEQFACEKLDSELSAGSQWHAAVAGSLGAIAARQWARGSCSLALPGHLALTKFLRIPSVPKEKLRKAVALEAAENIPYPLDDVAWDFAVVSDKEPDLEVMLAAAKLDAVQPLCRAAESAGLSIERAIPSGLSLWHAFQHSHPDVNESVLVANIGARSTQLLFVEAGRFRLRTVPMGGNTVTQLVSEGLRMDFASAELLKVQVLSGRTDLPNGPASRSVVQRAVSGFTAQLELEIIRSAIHYRRQTDAAPPVTLYLTGGGSLIGELPGMLAARLRLRVERLSPFRNVDVSADARAAGAEDLEHTVADMVGLAARVASGGEHGLNLLPPEMAEAARHRKRRPVLLAAGVAALVSLALPIVYFHHHATRTLEKVAQYENRYMPLRALERS